MSQLNTFVGKLRERNNEESYWRALEQFFGLDPSTLKATALQRCPDSRLPEKERIERGLKTMIKEHSETVNALAKNIVPVGKAASWKQVLDNISVADHALHICTPEEETAGMLAFLALRAKTDGKIFCLWHGDRVESMKNALGQLGYGKMLETAKIAILPFDKTRETMIREGNVASASREFDSLFDEAAEAEYPEFSLGGSLAGSLFRAGYYDLTRDWEAYLHRNVFGRNGAIYCPYPILNDPLNPEALEKIARVHNWVADSNQAYRLDLASHY